MSFLRGLIKVGSWISGASFSANLAKTAIIGYTVYRLNRNLNKANNPTTNIDEGVRLQVNPSAENKIPIVYGAAFLGGIVTDAEMSGDNKTMHFCITISEKTGTVFSTGAASTTLFREIYWNDQKITFKSDGVTIDFTQDRQGIIDRSLDGRARIHCYDGGSNNPVPVQGFSSQGLPAATAVMPSWTSQNQPMSNLVFAVVRVDYDRDRGVTSLGNLKFHIENSMTKPGDCLFDYFTNVIYGAAVPADEVDVNTLTALNTYSDLSVIYEDQTLGANQVLDARYRINGVVDSEQPVLNNIENLASSAGSWVSYDVQRGQWSLVINKEETPLIDFNDSTIIGSISVSGTGIDDLYNRVKVEFPNRDIRDAADFITIALPEQDKNANEYENTFNITYDLINEPVQAEILGFIELKQSRVDLVIRFTTDYSYTTLTAGDVISLTNGRFGWTNKVFRIVSVNEQQDDSGQLLVDITALEYDENVYSVLDLFRFTRTDQNGIITIGSIGVPGTPNVSKIEIDSRPRIVVTSLSPTGIVEKLEFWRTFDVGLAEAQRSYQVIGTEVPVGGGTFGINQTVTFEYDNQSAGNFLIKTRGVNTITTGPFSEPSGIIEFEPQQVTDTIGANTSLSGIIGALGALELLNLIDKLMKNDAGEGGLFDKVIEVFKDVTGVDLVESFGSTEASFVLGTSAGQVIEGQPFIITLTTVNVSDDTLVPFTITGVSSEDINGASLTGNFTVKSNRASLVVFVSEDAINVDEKTFTITLDDVDVSVSVILLDSDIPPPPLPPPPPPPPPDPSTLLTITELFPSDSFNFENVFSDAAAFNAPNLGSYFIRYGGAPLLIEEETPPPEPTLSEFYGSLEFGTGNIELYKSNGTLVETLTANDILIDKNVIELPFATRELGTDYYILMDQGVVNYCNKIQSPSITLPTIWNFRTAVFEVDAFGPEGNDFADIDIVPAPVVTAFTTTLCASDTFSISFDQTIQRPNTAKTFNINDANTDEVFLTVSTNDANYSQNTVSFSVTLESNKNYYLTAESGVVESVVEDCHLFSIPNLAITKNDNIEFSTNPLLEFVSFVVGTVPFLDINKTNKKTNIVINFNQAFGINTGKITLFSSTGIFQEFDVNSNFTNDFTSEIIIFSGTSITLNPTKVLDNGDTYHVLIDAGALRDSCNINFPGISDVNIIRFTVDPGPTSVPSPGFR